MTIFDDFCQISRLLLSDVVIDAIIVTIVVFVVVVFVVFVVNVVFIVVVVAVVVDVVVVAGRLGCRDWSRGWRDFRRHLGFGRKASK